MEVGLIFDAPEADLGVHPTDPADEKEPPSGTADISFYCDDIEKTVSELQSRGVEFTQEVQDHGYGLVTFSRCQATSKSSFINPVLEMIPASEDAS